MDPQAFIVMIAPQAMENMRNYHILASVTMAQAALESGWGAYVQGNNLFGIKGEGQLKETQEYVNNHWISVIDGFRVYDSWEGSIQDHSQFLLENPRYAAVIDERDYKAASYALQRAGYATDPQYALKLISIIESRGLELYDQQVWAANTYKLDPLDANKLIGFLAAGWHATEVAQARTEFHRLANELRKASGLPEQ